MIRSNRRLIAAWSRGPSIERFWTLVSTSASRARLVNRYPHLTFEPADFKRARGARVQQAYERLVQQVDSFPQIVEVSLHARPFSQRT